VKQAIALVVSLVAVHSHTAVRPYHAHQHRALLGGSFPNVSYYHRPVDDKAVQTVLALLRLGSQGRGRVAATIGSERQLDQTSAGENYAVLDHVVAQPIVEKAAMQEALHQRIARPHIVLHNMTQRVRFR
jgi:hypothetical protein